MLFPFIEFLNKYSNLLLSLLTSAYVLLTWLVVREMKYAREAEARPYIIIDSLVAGVRCYLIVKNVGKSAAVNVRFKINKPLVGRGNRVVNDLHVFAHGIDYFPPRKDFVFDLFPLHELHDKESKCPAEFSIKVTYEFLRNKKTEEVVHINMREFLFTNPTPNELVKSIETFSGKVSDKLDKLTTECSKIAKIESIVSQSGLEISYLTAYKLNQMLSESKGSLKLDLNLATHDEMVLYLELDSNMIIKIINERMSCDYFKTFEELYEIDGLTDDAIAMLKNKTFISDPNY